jgi:competence protein ComEC
MHRAKVFKLVLIAFILGVVAGRWLGLPLIAWISLVAVLVWIIIFLRPVKVKIISLIILFFILGMGRYQLSWPVFGPNRLEFYNGQKTIFTGSIIRATENNTDKKLVMEIKSINHDVGSGRVLIKAPLYSSYDQGQNLSVTCKILAPENYSNFNFVGYLAKDYIFSVCYYPDTIEVIDAKSNLSIASWLSAIKTGGQNLINKNFTEPQGALLAALLLGAQENLPKDFQEWLSKTGTSHAISVSGLHIVIMIMLVEMILFSVLGLKRNYAFYVTVIFVIFYVSLTGAAPAAIRSGIMGILLLYAQKIGRLYQAGNVIFLAAAIMLVVNPLLIFWDIGWQLSFLSMFGLIYLSPSAEKLLIKVPNYKIIPIRSYLVATCSAYLLTLPLVLYYFGNLSLVAPLANILILGAFPWAMMSGAVFLLGTMVFSFLGQILAWPCWLALTYIVKMIQWCANIPFSSFHLANFSLGWAIVCYVFLISVILIIKKNNPRWMR